MGTMLFGFRPGCFQSICVQHVMFKKGIKGGILAKARIESERIKTEIRPRLEERKEWRKRGRKEVGETHVQHGFCCNQYRFWSCRTLAGGNIMASGVPMQLSFLLSNDILLLIRRFSESVMPAEF